MRSLLIIALFFCFSGQLYAFCEGNKYPNISVEDEIKKSDFIVVGTVTKRMILVDPEEDPEGYEAEIFHVETETVLFGHQPEYVSKQYLTLHNSNGSSRFVMHVGEKYLLFVSSGADGYWINSCGNSGLFAESKENIDSIKKSVNHQTGITRPVER